MRFLKVGGFQYYKLNNKLKVNTSKHSINFVTIKLKYLFLYLKSKIFIWKKLKLTV